MHPEEQVQIEDGIRSPELIDEEAKVETSETPAGEENVDAAPVRDKQRRERRQEPATDILRKMDMAPTPSIFWIVFEIFKSTRKNGII